MSNVYEESLKLHEANHGKLSVVSKVTVKSREDLSLAYSPGVAEPCRKIQENKENVYRVATLKMHCICKKRAVFLILSS